MTQTLAITVGVLALQGAFSEHLQLLCHAVASLRADNGSYSMVAWTFIEVRTKKELARCDALVIPGGESTTISLVAQSSGLLEPLREFVKVLRKPTWGTCAGLILLAESANRTKKGGQELIGGLDVRVNRNHFGRQVESFEADLDLPFLAELGATPAPRFHSMFIRAPVVEKVLSVSEGIQADEARREATVVAPSKQPLDKLAKESHNAPVEILARLPGRARALADKGVLAEDVGEDGDIIAVKQGNCFGTSFHPELTGDPIIHAWWLKQVLESTKRRQNSALPIR